MRWVERSGRVQVDYEGVDRARELKAPVVSGSGIGYVRFYSICNHLLNAKPDSAQCGPCASLHAVQADAHASAL